MNKYLTRKILEMRKQIRSETIAPYVTLVKVCGNVYQLLFLSCGCNNCCTFCNYGFDYDLTKELVMPVLEQIPFEQYDIGILELEANGSFLSEREIPYDLFIATLEFIKKKDLHIPEIAIETHYKTITEKKLQDIRRILGYDQVVTFELGFESSSECVRKFYNKDIDNEEYIKTVNMCKKYGITCDINVLLGAPFLTREEQIVDCLNTLDYVYSNFPERTRCVLFPINIKSHTMLEVWERKGIYSQIPSWEFVELLTRIPKNYLDKLTIAWWGVRENAYTSNEIKHPLTCKMCHERLMDFYEDFYLNFDADYRKRIISEIWKTRCKCDK